MRNDFLYEFLTKNSDYCHFFSVNYLPHFLGWPDPWTVQRLVCLRLVPWKREAESAQLLGGLELVEASKREDLGLALQRKSELQTNLVLCKSSEPEREKRKEIECITSFFLRPWYEFHIFSLTLTVHSDNPWVWSQIIFVFSVVKYRLITSLYSLFNLWEAVC